MEVANVLMLLMSASLRFESHPIRIGIKYSNAIDSLLNSNYQTTKTNQTIKKPFVPYEQAEGKIVKVLNNTIFMSLFERKCCNAERDQQNLGIRMKGYSTFHFK